MDANQGASKPGFLRPWEEQTTPSPPAEEAAPQPMSAPARVVVPEGHPAGVPVGRGAVGEIYPYDYPPGLAMVGVNTAAASPQRDVLGTLYDGNQFSTPAASPYLQAAPPAVPPNLSPSAAPVYHQTAANPAIEHDHKVLMRELSMAQRRLSPAEAAQLSAVQQSYRDHVDVLERERLRAILLAEGPAAEVNEYFEGHRIKLMSCTRDHMREYCTAAASLSNRTVASKENTEKCGSGKGKGKGKGRSSKNARPENANVAEDESEQLAGDSKAQSSSQQSHSRESTSGYETEIDVGGPADEYNGFENVVSADAPNVTIEADNLVPSDGFNARGSKNDSEYAAPEASAAHLSEMKRENQSPDVSPASTKSAAQDAPSPTGNQPPSKSNPPENGHGSVKEENERSETSSTTTQRPKKGGKVVPFSRRTHEVLEEWYLRHFRRPYVQGEDAEALAEEAGGITVKQLRKWLSNRRNDDNNTRPGGYKRAVPDGGESRAAYGGPGFMPVPPFMPPAAILPPGAVLPPAAVLPPPVVMPPVTGLPPAAFMPPAAVFPHPAVFPPPTGPRFGPF